MWDHPPSTHAAQNKILLNLPGKALACVTDPTPPLRCLHKTKCFKSIPRKNSHMWERHRPTPHANNVKPVSLITARKYSELSTPPFLPVISRGLVTSPSHPQSCPRLIAIQRLRAIQVHNQRGPRFPSPGFLFVEFLVFHFSFFVDVANIDIMVKWYL